MGAVFTLDNASILALMNTISAIKKAQIRYGGKLSGQIFRLFKKDMPITFESKGNKSKRDTAVVHVESVDYGTYMQLWGSKISKDDLQALESLRARPYTTVGGFALPAPDAVQALEAPEQFTALEAPKKSNEELVRERANDPSAAALFEELCVLTGQPNTEEIRIKTASAFQDVGKMVDKLQGILREKRKASPKQAEPAHMPAPAQLPAQTADSVLY